MKAALERSEPRENRCVKVSQVPQSHFLVMQGRGCLTKISDPQGSFKHGFPATLPWYPTPERPVVRADSGSPWTPTEGLF